MKFIYNSEKNINFAKRNNVMASHNECMITY